MNHSRDLSRPLRSVPFFLCITGLFFIIISPSLFTEGMFFDGLYYAAISHHMANGFGTFWVPYFSETLCPEFYGHPPLAFGIQSLFFKLFGSHFLIEKLYSLFTILLSSGLILGIWKEVGQKTSESWIPLFFWILIPLVSWSSTNNLLENTMSVFLLFSILLYLKSFTRSSFSKYLFIFLSGIMLLLGFYTKGFTALFPFVLPFIYRVVFREGSWKQVLFHTGLMLAGFLLPLSLLWSVSTDAYTGFIRYFEVQIMGSLTDVQTVESRFFIVGKLFMELLIPLLFCVVLFVYGIRKNLRLEWNNDTKWAVVFILTGLAGVIPIMISMKQSGFYILATFPLFAMGLSLLVKPYWEELIHKLSVDFYRVISVAGILLLVTAVGLNVSNIGKIGRDRHLLEDLHEIIEEIPENSTILIHPSLSKNWPLYGYFSRYRNISLATVQEEPQFFLSEDKDPPADTAEDFSYMELGTKNLFLFSVSPSFR